MLTCEHCGGRRVGYGVVAGKKVCHPDIGMDCYHLVTVYGHEMPCKTCVSTSVTQVTQLLVEKFGPLAMHTYSAETTQMLLEKYRQLADEIVEIVRKGDNA